MLEGKFVYSGPNIQHRLSLARKKFPLSVELSSKKSNRFRVCGEHEEFRRRELRFLWTKKTERFAEFVQNL